MKMWTRGLLWASGALIAGCFVGCVGGTGNIGEGSAGTDAGSDVSDEAGCVVGQSAACACLDGASGAQVCQQDRTFADCVCEHGGVDDGPDSIGVGDAGVDTSDLDPLPDGVGGASPLACLGNPAGSLYITQGAHQNNSIDLACEVGDTLINPFPAPVRVIKVTTRYSHQQCYSTVDGYNANCSGSPAADAACNNLVVFQTTIGGVEYQMDMLHLSGVPFNASAGRSLQVGDVIDPFSPIALCGNIGWVCPGPGNDGSHVHITLHNLTAGVNIYPAELFSATCAPIQSGDGCTPGATCCGQDGHFVMAGARGTGCDDSCHACNGGGGCYSTCEPRCLSGDGLYCGGSVGLDANTLYDCRGGTYTVSEACSNGCAPQAANTPDRCADAPATGSCPDGDGTYCGGAVGRDGNTLYTCHQGAFDVSRTCADGCRQNSGPHDDCAPPPTTGSCPSGNGLYCGQTLGLDSNKLYDCNNGDSTVRESCANGCTVAPAGQADYCASGGGGGSCPSGNGLYCGQTLGLDSNKLYDCNNGNSTVRESCANGCTVAPAGQADYCASGGGGSCPSGNGLYCGQTLGLDSNTLYSCSNGTNTVRQSCSNGCVIAPPGQADYCR